MRPRFLRSAGDVSGVGAVLVRIPVAAATRTRTGTSAGVRADPAGVVGTPDVDARRRWIVLFPAWPPSPTPPCRAPIRLRHVRDRRRRRRAYGRAA